MTGERREHARSAGGGAATERRRGGRVGDRRFQPRRPAVRVWRVEYGWGTRPPRPRPSTRREPPPSLAKSPRRLAAARRPAPAAAAASSGSAAAVVDRHAATNWHAAARTAGASAQVQRHPGARGGAVRPRRRQQRARREPRVGRCRRGEQPPRARPAARAAVPRQPREPKRGARGRPRPGPSGTGRRFARRVQGVDAGVHQRAPPRANRPSHLLRDSSPRVHPRRGWRAGPRGVRADARGAAVGEQGLDDDVREIRGGSGRIRRDSASADVLEADASAQALAQLATHSTAATRARRTRTARPRRASR